MNSCDNQYKYLQPPSGIRPLCSRTIVAWRGLFSSMNATRPNTAERFWSKVNKNPSFQFAPSVPEPCWEWTAAISNNGYGKFSFNGKPQNAHKISWVLSFGEVPSGLLVCHKCDNRKCVNPSHLFLGNHQDNYDDARLKGKTVAPPIKRGEKCGTSKLKWNQVLAIRKMHDDGLTAYEIALKNIFPVTRGCICKILENKTWRFGAS